MPQRADDRSSTRDRDRGSSNSRGKYQVNDPWDERDDDHYLSDDDGTDGALSDDAPLLSRAPSFLDHSAASGSASAGASAERPYSDQDRRGEQGRASTSHIKMQRMNSQTGSREEYCDTDHIMPGSKHHNGGGGDKSSPSDEDEIGYKGYGGTNDLRTSSSGKRKGEEEDDPSSEPRTEVRAVDQEDYEEGDMSLDDLFDASRTAAENKSVLISHELDRMGFGRYQILLWTLCGFGYFIDLLWAQALGLIITPVLNEFSAGNAQSGLLSTAFSVGLTIGAFMWGFLVDVIGRKWSFYCTCLIASIFGIASGGANSYAALCVLMAFVGIGVGGNIPIDATITLEFLPTKRRFLLALLAVFQPLGVLVCSGIAYGFIPRYSCNLSPNSAATTAAPGTCTRAENMGWRYTLFTLGAITLAIFFARFAVFKFRESPFYLLSRGRERDALRVVEQIAAFNRARRPPKFSLDDFEEIDRRLGIQPGAKRVVAAKESARQSAMAMLRNFGNAKLLFSTPTMARLTILIWLTYIADFWAFSIAGVFLPQILIQKGAEADIPLSQTYANFPAIYAPGIAACLLAAAMVEVPRVGRQWAMVVSSAMMAVSLFLYSVVTTQAGSVGINAMEYFFQSLFNAILYAYTTEAYPSAVRGTGSGLASTWGRLASILAPIAGQSLFARSSEGNANVNGVLYVGGGVALIAPIALMFLPFDTRGRRTY